MIRQEFLFPYQGGEVAHRSTCRADVGKTRRARSGSAVVADRDQWHGGQLPDPHSRQRIGAGDQHRGPRAIGPRTNVGGDRLDPTARRVFEGLRSHRFAQPDEIAGRSGVPALEVIRALPTLELAGLAEAGDGGHRIAARLRGSR